jgi:hypothetical protein
MAIGASTPSTGSFTALTVTGSGDLTVGGNVVASSGAKAIFAAAGANAITIGGQGFTVPASQSAAVAAASQTSTSASGTYTQSEVVALYTDVASLTAKLNSALAALRAHGIIAT